MSLGLGLSEHLTELRRRLKVIFVSLFAAVLVVLLLPLNPLQILNLNIIFWTSPVTVFLQAVENYTLPAGWKLIPLTIGAPLEVLLYASLILGLAVDMPIIGYEVYRFIDPALKDEERAMVYPVVTSATILFAVGLLFGYFVLAKFIFIAMAPFYTAVGLTPPFFISVSDFYSIVFLCVLFSGVAFVSPVFVFLLIRFGIVPAGFFRKNRVFIWAATYIVTAIITPDGGPLLDVMLFVPVIALLELSIFVAGRYGPKGPATSKPTCKYCGEVMEPVRPFCQNCGRAVA